MTFNPDTEWYTITSRYFCAAISVKNETVVEAAPIIKYMAGWNLSRVINYTKTKGWVFE